MNFEESITYQLSRLTNVHRNLLQSAMNAVGLHSGQIFVLFELWKQDGLRQIDIAARLSLAPPTVNKILGGLLEGDFVTRARYEDDARSTRIFLTKKGIEIQGAVAEQWQLLEEQTTAGLTDTEILIFRQLLGKLLAAAYESDR